MNPFGRSLYLGIHLLWDRKTRRLKHQLIGAILGIGVSLIPLIVVMQIADGMIQGITARYVEVYTFHMQLRNYRLMKEEEADELKAKLESIEELRDTFKLKQGEGLLYTAKGRRLGTGIQGIPADFPERNPLFGRYVEILDGEFRLDDNSLMISEPTAKALEIAAGDEVFVLTSYEYSGRSPIIRNNRFTVAGVFTTGYHELDKVLTYLEYERSCDLIHAKGATSIALLLDDPYGNLSEIRRTVAAEKSYEWYLYSWKDLQSGLYANLTTTRKLLVFIMFLILVVASVNIASTLVMMVMEKQKEIAILKSFGTPNLVIRLTFLQVGFIIGLCGTALGIICGILTAVNINGIFLGLEKIVQMGINLAAKLGSGNVVDDFHLLDPEFYLQTIPVSLKFREITSIAFLSVSLATAASFRPALNASRVAPLSVLRKH